jgi:MFS superfamily sulfate permease-like transporter
VAQPVDIGAAKPAKIRSPVAVAVLAFVTIFIYLFFWWYFVNREMADYGRVRGTNELGDSPGKSVLAIIGALVIVPAIWTTVRRSNASRPRSGSPVRRTPSTAGSG